MANNLGLALQGLGAGIQGKGAEFNAQLMAQRESDEARAEKQKQERLKTFYMDSMSALNFIANKQPDQAAKIFFERSELLHQVPGADPIDSDTMAQLFMMAQSGDQEAAQRIVDTLGGIVNTGVAGGYINAPPQQPKPFQKVEGGQVIRERDDGSFYATDIEGYKSEDGALTRGDIQKQVNTLRGSIEKSGKDFEKIEAAKNRITKTGSKGTAASDISLVFNFMKMNDPGSTVREGEFATAQNATGVDGRIINAYNSLLRGTRLSQEQRQDFISQSEGLFEAQRDAYDSSIDNVLQQADQDNIPRVRILGEKRLSDFTERMRLRNMPPPNQGQSGTVRIKFDAQGNIIQ